jgi:uncharacterized membrane protein YcaP (DUF421 family)
VNPVIFPGGFVLLQIVLRTLTVYTIVLLGVRLSGKREVGQMTPFDLTLLLLLSNAVQNAMTGPDTSVIGGGTAAITLLVVNYVVAELASHNRKIRKILRGDPAVLVHNGQVLQRTMAREHVGMDDLEEGLREHGIATIEDVALAVLEVDGNISFLKYDDVESNSNPKVRRRVRFLHKH